MYEIRMTWTVITSFSPLKPGFDPRAHVGSVVNTAVLRYVYPVVSTAVIRPVYPVVNTAVLRHVYPPIL